MRIMLGWVSPIGVLLAAACSGDDDSTGPGVRVRDEMPGSEGGASLREAFAEPPRAWATLFRRLPGIG